MEYANNVGLKKYIYASSGGVYGFGKIAFPEESPLISPGELGFYLGSKLSGESLVQSYSKLFEICILRFFFIYGKNQNRNMLIPRLFDSVANGKPIQLVGNEGIRINPVHVEDAAAFVVNSMGSPGNVTCNVAGPDVMSIREICKSFGEYLGKEPLFQQLPGIPNDLIGDISRQTELFNKPLNRLIEKVCDIEP